MNITAHKLKIRSQYSGSIKIGLFGLGNDGKSSMIRKFDKIYRPLQFSLDLVTDNRPLHVEQYASFYNINDELSVTLLQMNSLENTEKLCLDGIVYVYGASYPYDKGYEHIQKYASGIPHLIIHSMSDITGIPANCTSLSCITDSNEYVATILTDFAKSIKESRNNAQK